MQDWLPTRVEVQEYVVLVSQVVLVLVLGWLALRFLLAPLQRLLQRGRVDPSVASFLLNTGRSVILAGVLLVVLQRLGVPTASLITLLGAAGLAVALSLQNSLANFAAGLLVLAFRIVRIGDLVEVGDLRGRVAEMLPFHIVLISPDNQQITVPNTMLTTGGVRNNSALSMRRAGWTLTLTPRDDLAAVKERLRARVQADGRILSTPPPDVFVQQWDEDRRLLTVQAWTATADYPAVQVELLEALGTTLEQWRREQSPPAAT